MTNRRVSSFRPNLFSLDPDDVERILANLADPNLSPPASLGPTLTPFEQRIFYNLKRHFTNCKPFSWFDAFFILCEATNRYTTKVTLPKLEQTFRSVQSIRIQFAEYYKFFNVDLADVRTWIEEPPEVSSYWLKSKFIDYGALENELESINGNVYESRHMMALVERERVLNGETIKLFEFPSSNILNMAVAAVPDQINANTLEYEVNAVFDTVVKEYPHFVPTLNGVIPISKNEFLVQSMMSPLDH